WPRDWSSDVCSSDLEGPSRPAAEQVPGEQEEQEEEAQTQEVEPPVGAEREPRRRRRLREDDALRAPGPAVEVLEDLRHREGQGRSEERRVGQEGRGA